MKTLIVIPARYASTRFPGKPLHPINGVSMLARTAGAAQRAAKASGARVVIATDDERIAAHASEIGVESVMTDVGLPVMDGRELAKQAHMLRPELPILFASGYAESIEVPDGMHIIGKPFSIDQLRDKVKSILVQA